MAPEVLTGRNLTEKFQCRLGVFTLKCAERDVLSRALTVRLKVEQKNGVTRTR